MSYCVNCGVELADSEERCPLCKTPVVNPAKPDFTPSAAPFPTERRPKLRSVGRKSAVTLATLLLLLPLSLSLVCDLSISGQIGWSGYVAGSLILLWFYAVLPIRQRGTRAATVLLIDCIATLCFLCYIAWRTGGDWFYPFAAAETVLAFGMAILIVLLSQRTGIPTLYLLAVGLALSALFCLFTEWLINGCFGVSDRLRWSWYPLAANCVLVAILIFVERNAPLKAWVQHKFFV